MKNKLIILAVLAMCLCAGAPAWAANLVLNGDFESPGIEEAAADNWTHVSVNAGWNKTENNGFGTFHLVIGNGSACDGRCEQVVSASAGTNYQLSFQYNRDEVYRHLAFHQ